MPTTSCTIPSGVSVGNVGALGLTNSFLQDMVPEKKINAQTNCNIFFMALIKIL
jgi:hypothetical protein